MTLATAVKEGVWATDWRTRLDELWDMAAAGATAELKAAGDYLGDVDPRRWPDYELRRARLTGVFEDIASLVVAAGPAADILTEQNLVGAGGRIRGRADLVIRSDLLHVVVDYKTGYVTDESGELNADYVRQMQLYGYLESERSGTWPSEAYLVSFAEPAVRVTIDHSGAADLVRAALSELDAFNKRAPHGPQPARPGPITCRYCDFAGQCAAFWDASSPDWSDAVLAVRGPIRRVVSGQLPVVNIEMEAKSGSVPAGALLIRQVATADFPWAASAQPGQVAAAVGLVAEGSRRTYRLRPRGHLWTGPPDPKIAPGAV